MLCGSQNGLSELVQTSYCGSQNGVSELLQAFFYTLGGSQNGLSKHPHSFARVCRMFIGCSSLYRSVQYPNILCLMGVLTTDCEVMLITNLVSGKDLHSRILTLMPFQWVAVRLSHIWHSPFCHVELQTTVFYISTA